MSFENPTAFHYIERAVLLEDVKLPILNNKHKFTRLFFSYLDEFKLAYNEIKNIDAKFYIPTLMTTFDSKDEVNVSKSAPSKTGFKGNIKSLPYKTSNYCTLTIPKYILLQWLDLKNETPGVKDAMVPKGTEFLVACVGGAMDLDHMRIIGIYTVKYPKKDFPQLTDDYYGGNPVI